MKVISVPLTKKAMERLDTDNNIEGDLIDIEISQKEFDILYKSGVIFEFNSCLNINIDDFEDESIPYKDIDQALSIIKKYKNSSCNSSIFQTLIIQLLAAKEAKTGVFLFL